MSSLNSASSASDTDEYRLERVHEGNEEDWDNFNTYAPEGSILHSLRWKRIVETTSDIREQYRILYKNDDVFGIFPLVEERSRLFRGLRAAFDPRRLHAVLQDNSDPFAMECVIRQIQESERTLRKISYLQVSTLHEETLNTVSSRPLVPLPRIGDMVLDLSENPPDLLWDTFSAKRGQRKFIRRFDEHGFAVTEVHSLENLKDFYKYYKENMEHNKYRPQPFSRFTDLCRCMSDDIRITLLSKGAIVAGGMLTLLERSRGRVSTIYLSLNRDLPNTYHAPYYLWWDAITWAWDHDYSRVSFGAVHDQDDKDPRYRIKYDLGARFQPIYSGLIPLGTTYSLNMQWDAWRKNRRSPAPGAGDVFY